MITLSAPLASPVLTDVDLHKSPAKDNDHQASDDFANLLAAAWYAPFLQQTPTPTPDSGQGASADGETAGTAALEQPAGLGLPLFESQFSNLTTSFSAPSAGDTFLGQLANANQPAAPAQTLEIDPAVQPVVTAGVTPTVLLPAPVIQPDPQSAGAPPAIPLPATETLGAQAPPVPLPLTLNSASEKELLTGATQQSAVAATPLADSIEQPTKPSLAAPERGANDKAPNPLTISAPQDNTGVGTPPVASQKANTDVIGKAAINVDPQSAGDNGAAVQTMQIQAAQRDASLIAGYLAAANRTNNDSNPLQAIRRQFAGSSDLNSNEGKNDSAGANAGLAQGIQTDKPFAAVAGEVALGNAPDSVATQSAAQIIVSAETLDLRQVRSLRLRLHPEELGQVEVQLNRDAQGKISAHLTADRETGRQALSQTLDQLRATLERAGLIVDRLQVSSGTTSLSGNSAGDNDGPQNSKSQSETVKSQTVTETEDRGTERVHDHKLLSLSA